MDIGPRRNRRLPQLTFALALAGAVGSFAVVAPAYPQAPQDATAFLIVDCLLPGQIRRLGGASTFLTARRPVRTSGVDCEIRGGEYVAYDRADYKTALGVWLPAAREGDAKAQAYVGQIYEKGLGVEPDYAQAADWYRRAAERGYTRAYVSLGNLYEQGLGVKRDPLAALNLYRKAVGANADIALDPDGAQAQAATAAAAQSAAQAAALNAENQKLRAELAAAQRSLGDIRKQLAEAERARTESERQRDRFAADARAQGRTGDEQSQRLAAQLREREEELARQRRTAAQQNEESERLRAQLAQLEAARKADADAAAKTLAAREREIAAARAEVSRRDRDLAQVEADRRKAGDERSALAAQQAAAQRARDDAKVAVLESQLARRDEDLRAKEAESRRIAEEATRYREQLAQLEAARKADAAGVAANADKQAREVVALRRELDQTRKSADQAARDQAKLEQARRELAASVEAARARDAEQAKQYAAELAKRDAEVARQQARAAQIEKDLAEKSATLARLEAAFKGAQAAAAAPEKRTTGVPVIEIIDPTLVSVRGSQIQMASLAAGSTVRDVVGRVTAAAGLFSLTINDQRADADSGGMFKSSVPLRAGQTPVQIVAVDREGRRAMLEFLISAGEAAREESAKPRPVIPPIKFGNYHALMIGNADYKYLEKLDTTINDVRDIGKLLRERFGFQVTTLTNASRYEILRELNKLRDKLTENDNLLIYYAGHGELDRANMRGHWLPIDAEKHSRANWISNIDITDILNEMEARHVLVVADSCFSGALTRGTSGAIQPGRTDEQNIARWKLLAEKRSRIALTSGDLQPVPDGGGGDRHSLFAKVLLDTLNGLSNVTEAQSLHRIVATQVHTAAARLRIEQRPLYAAIPHTGHEFGEFLFVPK